jgi:hypothetical protein
MNSNICTWKKVESDIVFPGDSGTHDRISWRKKVKYVSHALDYQS